MKRYIKADTGKPVLDDVEVIWAEIENGSGILFDIYSGDELLFEEIFDYASSDYDTIYDSAVDMALTVLSMKYDLTDNAINTIKNKGEQGL